MDPVLLMQLCMVEKIAFQFQINNMFCKPAQLNRTLTNNNYKKLKKKLANWTNIKI